MEEIIDTSHDKYRLYAIHFAHGLNRRMLMVHIGRPVSFKTMCDHFVFNNTELTIEKTNEKISVSDVTGIQKIPNDNIPLYELTLDGTLKDI